MKVFAKKLYESKRILSSSGDMLQWEKSSPTSSYLKRLFNLYKPY